MSHMGTEEMGSFSKMLEQTSSSTTGVMQFPPEWAAFQAYYSSGMAPMPPPNPYMWGAQPMMPPYGTPPFTSVYPHGGMYAHPSMSAGNHPYNPYGLATGNTREAQGALVPVGLDAEGKSKYGNAKSPVKKSNGSLGNVTKLNSKGEDAQKGGPPRSINGFGSYSADSGSEGSTEGSEENSQFGVTDQLISEAPNGGLHNVNHVEGSNPVLSTPITMGGKQSMSAEAGMNLNHGTIHWNGGTGLLHAGGQCKRGGSAAMAMAAAPSTNMLGHAPDRVTGELGLQDERELKRQKRKLSNRESARRSRLRKQAECEELAVRVEALSKENTSLQAKLNQVTEECRMLSEENCSLLDQLQLCRPEQDVNGVTEKNTKFPFSEALKDNMKLHNKSLHKEASLANDNSNPSGGSHVDSGVNLKGFAAIFPHSSREAADCDTFTA